MAGLSDLCLNLGAKFEHLVRARLGCSVSPTSNSPLPEFYLVTSFGRSAVRLNADFVGLLLQSCLGEVAKDFNVTHLLGWMFKFSVSCKNVGFMIRKIRSFSCKLFEAFFHLWGGGGPDWQREVNLWTAEQEAEWCLVCSKSSKKSYADMVKSNQILKEPARPARSIFLHLQYPANYQD